jgi:hypothetical protein
MRTRRVTLTLALALAAGVAPAQPGRGTAELSVGGKQVSVDYGRPSLQGRDMLSKAPPGFVWRVGANQATVLASAGELVFGEKTLPKGSYSLFARRVDDSRWELILNEQTGQWGTQRDPEQDALTVPLEWTKQDASAEIFTIALEPEGDAGATFRLIWGTDVLATTFQVR